MMIVVSELFKVPDEELFHITENGTVRYQLYGSPCFTYIATNENNVAFNKWMRRYK